ncbi:hypothetical protein AGABI1DRAFT_109945 [Agaricus bisporus var. burnettii JB137-S8]|uniref:Uncharacterized protein n=1 Tax=Agaricus bisporus var. burnettii (strain JB137-S8 / ATCC MYA-4627 / FGSC 10392) TaxID=597362 RepID=K5XJ63_AGABU|nr:uncharacterized protein AGABI1DRAFT_109945 [Agaricus bisporus var. burnettii JB137-S8]EKM74495.1 hypothetical protein AGABI1DRAFT_109945 [Agaricus bisporus var. burnettii JB137-S8]
MSLNLPGSIIISGLAFLENNQLHILLLQRIVLGQLEQIAKVEYGPSSATHAPIMLSTSASPLRNEDYCFVGDIETLLPATPECAQHVGCKVHVTICGIVEKGSDYEKEVSFFYLTPTQYVSIYHKKFDATFKSTLPIRCVIKESQRWTAITKPKPRPGKVVAISGFISEIVRTSDEKVECIEVIPDQVIYLTDVQLPVSKIQNTLDSCSTPDNNLKRKLRFSGFGTPSPASNKRPKSLPIVDLDSFSMESIVPSSPSPAPSGAMSSSGPTITLPARSQAAVSVCGPAAAAMSRNKGK